MDTILLVFLAALSRLVPHVPNATAVGGIALFSGARLPRRAWAIFVPLAAMAISDFFIDFGTGRAVLTPIRLAVYGSMGTSVILGRRLRGRSSVARTAVVALASSAVFFAVTNFAVWTSTGVYPPTPRGLFLCYVAALPYLRNEALGTLAWTGALFGAAALARRSREGRRASLIASIVAVLAAAPVSSRAQTLPPVAENVVVSASLAPEEEPAVSASVTVISRKEIEESGKTSLLELLRAVPGVDVVESGDAGKQTSVFLRGTNSTQTLVLVDGVKLNSPFFSGYDFSALSTQDVERIEVTRGPFSALYGSDAVGGVISIWTRAPSKEPAGRASVAFGNKSFHEETLFASAGAGDVSIAVSGRDVRDGGDRETVAGQTVDNDGWRDREAAVNLRWAPSDDLSVGALYSRIFARSQIPSDGFEVTPHHDTDFAQTLASIPISWRAAENNRLQASISAVDLHPTSVDSDQPLGAKSDTRARTQALRVVDRWDLGSQTLSATASYEGSTVDESDPFGGRLDGRRIHLWGVGAEDRASLFSGRLVAVFGIRYDRHSEFGDSTNPRVSIVWVPEPRTAVRASYGTAFRAPSIGELFYPFGGNPDLQPERSKSYELGFHERRGPVEFDVALFRNDIRDLIQYVFAENLNENVGRARTEGVEFSTAARFASDLTGTLSYTYLRAIDEETRLPLQRRPRHRASIDLAWSPARFLATVSAIFVGRRSDVDAATFATIEDPSYVRFDAFFRYALVPHVEPFLRVENLTDRKYAEADGFPAPRRRIAAGVSASF